MRLNANIVQFRRDVSAMNGKLSEFVRLGHDSVFRNSWMYTRVHLLLNSDQVQQHFLIQEAPLPRRAQRVRRV